MPDGLPPVAETGVIQAYEPIKKPANGMKGTNTLPGKNKPSIKN